MPAQTIDFAGIKESIGIDTVVQALTIPKLIRHGDQFRAPCPACRSGGERALVVTTSKKSFYCFAAKRGGDCIALTAHVQGTGQKEAAQWIEHRFQLGQQSGSSIPRSQPRVAPEPERRQAIMAPKAIERLAYLEAQHEALQEIGVSAATLESFDAGYAPRGVLRGRLAVPICTTDGTLVAYVGIAVNKEQSPYLLFHSFDPESALFNIDRVNGDNGVYVARDPLDVLKAAENGIDNCVSFLSPITANALTVLVNWMDQKSIENVEMLG